MNFFIVTINLEDNNLGIWGHQLFKILSNLELESYVLEGAPMRYLRDGLVNPQFRSWKWQDEILGGWLMAYMTNVVLKQVGNFCTSHESWTILENNFASRSCARIIQIKEEYSI